MSKTNCAGIIETIRNEEHSVHPVIVLSAGSSVVRIERDRDAVEWKAVGYGGDQVYLSSRKVFRGVRGEANARRYAAKWIDDRNARLAVEHAEGRAWLAEGNESESLRAQLRVAERVCSCGSCEAARATT